MIDNLIKLLKIPSSFRTNSTKITKALIFRKSDLTNTEKRTLDSSVEELTNFAIAGRSCNIPAFSSDERNYPEVLFLSGKLKIKSSVQKIAPILISIFNDPIVLILFAGNDLYIAAGRKRLNQNEKGKQITEEVRVAGPLNLNSLTDKVYLQALAIPNLKHTNLFELHESLLNALTPINEELKNKLNDWMDSDKELEKLDEFAYLASQYNFVFDEIIRLKSIHEEERKQGEFGHGMQIHLEIKKKEKEKSELLKKIKNTFTRR